MGDSSCSGSTPFKSLVEYGAQDRSLHQDRFSGAPGTQQGFRSTGPIPSTQAQAAFGAFLGSNGPGSIGPNTLPAHSSSIPNPFPGLQASHMAGGGHHGQRFSSGSYHSSTQIQNTPGLAATSVPHSQNQAVKSPLRASDWAQDFARFSRGAPNAAAGGQASRYPNMEHHQPTFTGVAHNTTGLQPMPSFFRPVNGPVAVGVTNNNAVRAEAEFDLEMDRWMAAHGDGHIEDVDAIMEELARELEQDQQARVTTQATGHGLNTSIDPAVTSVLDVSIEADTRQGQFTPATTHINQQASVDQKVPGTNDLDISTNMSLPAHVPDISRLVLGEASQSAPAEPAGHDQSQSEISEAARQILESVQHEQGDKWKNSRFLLLMKDFRDGNKDIVNNEIMETSAGDEQTAGN